MIDSTCPFCCVPLESPQEILAQNEYCFLVDNPKGSLQHGMMIIPFRHFETPFEFSSEEWAAIQPLISEAKARFGDPAPDGFNLGWNVGKTGGQEVLHAHLHVFARFANEPYAGKGIRHWFKSKENRR